MSCRVLDWSVLNEAPFGQFDLLVGSDVMYDQESMPGLVANIARLVSREPGKYMVAPQGPFGYIFTESTFSCCILLDVVIYLSLSLSHLISRLAAIISGPAQSKRDGFATFFASLALNKLVATVVDTESNKQVHTLYGT